MDAELFDIAIEAAITLEKEKGIGTLSEGVLHSAVKYYYQPDSGLHEVCIGDYVCDAITETRAFGRTVIEVQTAAFRNLKKKLSEFLLPNSNAKIPSRTDPALQFNAVNPQDSSQLPLSELSGLHCADFPGQVTVVYPLESSKRIVWIDPETGESTVGRRTSGFVPARCLRELYQLKGFVGKDGFRFVILGLEVKEEKLLCGRSRDKKKYGARRIARIPEKLTHEIIFEKLSDYNELIPQTLGNKFTASDFKKAAKLSEKRAAYSIGTLLNIGVLTREKVGRAYEYTRVFRKTSDTVD